MNRLKDLFVLENPVGSYKDFGAQHIYPIPGVLFYADYGYIKGYTGEDKYPLDVFIGNDGNKHGFFTVWRGEDTPQEHKFYTNMTTEQLRKTLEEYSKVLINQESLTEAELVDAISGFQDQ